MFWTCVHCGTKVDDHVSQCWQCGSGLQGEPPPVGWRKEALGLVDGSGRTLACLRCERPMRYCGLKHFQTGSYAKELLLTELLIERERMDMYRCEGCGKIEFFADIHRTARVDPSAP